MTGYTRLELGDCAKELHLLHQLAAQAELQAVRNKYSLRERGEAPSG